MINDLVARTAAARRDAPISNENARDEAVDNASMISALEEGAFDDATLTRLRKEWQVTGRQDTGHRYHRHGWRRKEQRY